jgi:hypothetical protein
VPAVILDNVGDWDLAWNEKINPSGFVVSQRIHLEDEELIRWQVGVIRKFFDSQKPEFHSLLVIDEGMDFFGPTGNSRYGNAIQRCWRAGGEKGMSCLIGLQRPKTVNLQMLTESNMLALFPLRYTEDVKRLQEMGFPKGYYPPEANPRKNKGKFLFMKNDELFPKAVRLKI